MYVDKITICTFASRHISNENKTDAQAAVRLIWIKLF